VIISDEIGRTCGTYGERRNSYKRKGSDKIKWIIKKFGCGLDSSGSE
jgi:hypothetical protein